jgi:hypothetical protein
VGLVTTISFHGHLTFTFPARFPTFLRDCGISQRHYTQISILLLQHQRATAGESFIAVSGTATSSGGYSRGSLLMSTCNYENDVDATAVT